MTCEIINGGTIGTINLSDNKTKPTLVLDAGMGNWSLFFYPLAQELSKFAKVCLISRDGYLDSHASPKSIASVAQQMKDTLEINYIVEPIILVGHSLGGLHVRMFQHLFPQMVQGMILLDSAHPRMPELIPDLKSNLEKQIRMVKILRLLAKLGLLRLAKSKIPTFGLPVYLHKQYFKVTTQATYYRTYQAEMQDFESRLSACTKLSNLGTLPLLVISSTHGLNDRIDENISQIKPEDPVWIDLQEDLTRLSTNATFIKSKEDHFLHLTDTEFVSNSIREFSNKFF